MKQTVDTSVKSKLREIYLYITWGKFSNTYLGKSSSWLYNKFNGVDGNGGIGGFTEEEKLVLKSSLLDFSNKIRSIAEEI